MLQFFMDVNEIKIIYLICYFKNVFLLCLMLCLIILLKVFLSCLFKAFWQ